MGKAIRASLLLLLLCSVARAGHIPNFPPTPPPSPVARTGYIPDAAPTPPAPSVERAGYIPNGATNILTQTLLDLFALLPSLL